jgi:glycosyltransferase involved in cell wall biosynthesis
VQGLPKWCKGPADLPPGRFALPPGRFALPPGRFALPPGRSAPPERRSALPERRSPGRSAPPGPLPARTPYCELTALLEWGYVCRGWAMAAGGRSRGARAKATVLLLACISGREPFNWREAGDLTSRNRIPSSGSGDAVFVMPYFADADLSREYFIKAVSGLRQQSDPDWRLIVINDASPRDGEVTFLERIASADNRIALLHQPVNTGPGVCRNLGVAWASDIGAGIVLFHDADDVSHPRRLELTRKIFAERPEVDMVYSSFQVIDEDDCVVSHSALTPSISEILDGHRQNPVEGTNAWIRIGTETGYTTQTSTVAVRSRLAIAQPFPDVRGSEDSNTWYRMCADGNVLAFMPEITSKHRVPRGVASSDRVRVGRDRYYQILVDMNRDGFERARDIALRRQSISTEYAEEIYPAFLRRLSVTVQREQEFVLAESLITEAEEYEARLCRYSEVG